MATEPLVWSELAERALAAAGRRAGGARRAVVEQLARQDCCLSAQEIAESMRAEGNRVGIASVYRALDLLHARGLVQRVEFGAGAARYEALVPGGDHHHHVVCDRCGLITPFENAGLERAIERVSDEVGHRVSAHEVVIRGECRACEAAQA
jgi:Fur family transcriptional regulator, ferric uptake regulator